MKKETKGTLMKYICLLVPSKWVKLIDRARKDVSRDEFIRIAIRDCLIKEGVWYEKENVNNDRRRNIEAV